MYVVLVYGISQNNNGQRRWSHVFKTCKKYLPHIQNSVFEGEISDVKLKILCSEADKLIDKDEDSIIIFKGRQREWLEKEIIGKELVTLDNFL